MIEEILKKNKLSIALILFTTLFCIIIYLKPRFLFTKDGAIRQFGLGKINSSIIPIWIVVFILAIFCYLFICCN